MSLGLLCPLRLKHLIDYFLREKRAPSSMDIEVAFLVDTNIELAASTTTTGDKLMHALFTLFALLLLLSLLLQRCYLVFVDELSEKLFFHVLIFFDCVKRLRWVRFGVGPFKLFYFLFEISQSCFLDTPFHF